MKHSTPIALFIASTMLSLAGCTTMSNGQSARDTPSATTREQCRQQGATAGAGRSAMTAKIDVDCATLMPN
jgi:hypothetical protein